MQWLLVTVSLVAALFLDETHETSRPEGAEPPAIRSTTRAFKIPFLIPDPTEEKHLQEVLLYVARDGGPWEKYASSRPDVLRDQRSFVFNADADGEYRFAIRTIDKSGHAIPEEDRDLRADLRVVIETKRSTANIHLLSLPFAGWPIGLPWFVFGFNPTPEAADANPTSPSSSPEPKPMRRHSKAPRLKKPSTPALENNSERQAVSVPERVDEVLSWLPADTETLIVAQGRIPVGPTDDKAEPPIERIFQTLPISLLSTVVGKESATLLHGQKIELAIQGSRRFQPPTALGMMRFDGCQIIFFEENAGSACERFFESHAGNANENTELAGHRILVFTRTFEADKWTVFVTRPKPNGVFSIKRDSIRLLCPCGVR